MAIKRSIEDIEFERTIAIANYIKHYYLSTTSYSASTGSASLGTGRVYECKTCNRQFPSFQALGGHRASHKKPRTSIGEDDADHNIMDESNAGKRKIHACSICGLKFPIGQALGGHMRRHRGPISGSSSPMTLSLIEASLNNSHNNGDKSSDLTNNMNINGDHDHHRRVMCLDLNLTPLENGLLEFGKLAPIVC